MIPSRNIRVAITDNANHTIEFANLRELYDFAKRESKAWTDWSTMIDEINPVNHPVVGSFSYFDSLVSSIESWTPELDELTDDHLMQRITSLNAPIFNRLHEAWLWSGHAYTEPFVRCFIEHNANVANAFLSFTSRGTLSNLNNKDSFIGQMLGYEFVNQASDIVKRRNGEKVSLGRLRSSFADAKSELFSEVDDLKAGFSEWDDETRIQFDRLYRANKYLGERRIRHHNKQFDERLNDWCSAIDELEKTYEEKLRLKKPAEYWKNAASKYGRQAILWTLSIIALSILGIVYFRDFFVTWLQGHESDLRLNTIQGIILFGSIAAAFAYLMKVLSRLAFSSFHLMRDAEEREQLTYLYLALINESEFDKDARDIVLQALFSRTETGLLQQEQGPTMPGVSEIMRNLAKARS